MDKIRNIIDMSPFLNDARHPSIREVEGYWQALREGRLVPRRSEIDPRGIERSLEYAFVLERIAPGIARLRIAGSHLSDLMGMEVRGMPVSAFFAPADRNRFGDVLEQVFDSPATAEISLQAERGIGKPAIEARMILLPLKSDLGDITRAIGCLSTNGAIGRAPRRFAIEEARVTPLLADLPAGSPDHAQGSGPGTAPDAAPNTAPAGATPAETDAPRRRRRSDAAEGDGTDRPAGFAEPAATFTPAEPRLPSERPWLRLVRSDRD